MAIEELFTFRSRESLAFAIFLIVFAAVYFLISRFMRNKQAAVIISLVVSIIGAWKLYTGDFYGWENTFVWVLIIMVIGIIISFFVKRRRKFPL